MSRFGEILILLCTWICVWISRSVLNLRIKLDLFAEMLSHLISIGWDLIDIQTNRVLFQIVIRLVSRIRSHITVLIQIVVSKMEQYQFRREKVSIRFLFFKNRIFFALKLFQRIVLF